MSETSAFRKESTYGQTRLPVDMASTLIPDAYHDAQFFAEERHALWSTSWVCVGLLGEVTAVGETIVRGVAGTSIIVTRDKEGVLHAFHNVCRHRGTQLLRSSGKKRAAITCPYHNWSYSIEGELVSVPQKRLFDEEVLDSLSLYPASVAEWNGILFVHPEEHPDTDLAGWLGSFVDHFGPHTPTKYEAMPPEIHEWAANWKIVVENYVDGYHLFHLHEDTLDMYDHAAAETSFHNRHFAFYEPPTEDYRGWLKKHKRWQLPDWSAERYGAWVHMLYPATGLTGTELSWSIFQITPLAVAN